MTRQGGLLAAIDRLTQRARRLLKPVALPARDRSSSIPGPRSASPFFQGREFDSFLLAPIREEKNGMLLSVLSALARQDLDPWREAARLSRLPRLVATESLCAMIMALPAGANNAVDPRSIALRLAALLPIGGASPQKTTASGALAPQTDGFKYVVAMVLILSLLSVAASSPPPASIEDAGAQSASLIVSPALGY